MGIQETASFGDDGFVIHRSQNVAGIVDYAKARHNEGHHGFSDFKLAAVVPEIVVEHYCLTHGVSPREFAANPEHMKRIVNDPAFADLRVAPGRI